MVGRTDGWRVSRVDVEGVLVDRDPVGVFALYENHADRSGRHRHAKYGVHFPSKDVELPTGFDQKLVTRLAMRGDCRSFPERWQGDAT
jgi:hypothetical protein